MHLTHSYTCSCNHSFNHDYIQTQGRSRASIPQAWQKRQVKLYKLQPVVSPTTPCNHTRTAVQCSSIQKTHTRTNYTISILLVIRYQYKSRCISESWCDGDNARVDCQVWMLILVLFLNIKTKRVWFPNCSMPGVARRLGALFLEVHSSVNNNICCSSNYILKTGKTVEIDMSQARLPWPISQCQVLPLRSS